MCYRLVYHELLISPTQVHDLLSLAGYIVCNYLLYLQVSGQFHIACGMLHLFGFQLPETHHHYLLATGFTDYWRRINIYWKDFMIRIVFNPVVFRLQAMAAAVCPGRGDGVGLRGDLALACLPVVLAAGDLGLHGAGCAVLGNLGRLGFGERPARRAGRSGARPGTQFLSANGLDAGGTGNTGDQGRGYVHRHRRALVPLVEPQPFGLV